MRAAKMTRKIKSSRVGAVAEKLRDEFEDESLPPIGDEEFDQHAPVEFTDEDVAAEAEEMPAAKRDALERSRKRGQAAREGRAGHRTAEAQVGARTHRENEFVYRPLNSLDAPPPQQGMEQRWIRVMLGDKNDVRNWAKQSRYGWTPRKLDTVPSDFNPPTQQMDALGSVIMVGDLVLCERPLYIGRARRKFMAERHARQMAATKRHVKKVEREDHPIRVVDRSDIPDTVGRGRRRVHAQGDE